VGGKDSSNAWISPREFIPRTSSILGEVDIGVFKESGHPSRFSLGKLRGFAFIH
tara:strand:+ start:1160 stop:1321 length:162 start_codon:yes stop_codon:yes gene_type:complete